MSIAYTQSYISDNKQKVFNLKQDLQALNKLQNVNGVLMMSSLDIAKQTDKQLNHVHRDIRKMLNSLKDDPNMDHNKFQVVTDIRNYVTEYLLDKELSYTLVTGYDVKLRNKIIKRWQELEQQQTTSPAQQSVHDACLASLTWLSENLRLSESSKVKLLSEHHKELGLPSSIIPNYVDEKLTDSLTALLKKRSSKLSARKANLILVELGYLEQLERKSTKGNKVRKFYSITDAGLKYGKNTVSPNNPRQTQPLFYRDTFEEFLNIIDKY